MRIVDKGYKTYRFRIYPNMEQQVMFTKTFDCVRFLYNRMLTDKIEYFKQYQKPFHKSPAQYKLDFPWLREVDSMALANALINLKHAFTNFFTLPGYRFPKFKSKKNNFKSYTTNRVQNRRNLELLSSGIKIPKVGIVKMKQHRNIPDNFILKSATIMQVPSGRYYVSILFEYNKEEHNIQPKKIIGLDFSMHSFYMDSNGEEFYCPRYFYQAEKKIAREHRRLSRMQKDSKNYHKQRIRIAKIYERVANQRRDFLHKQSRQIANAYDCVCVEDLNMQTIAQRFSFGKPVGDDAWGMFVRFLEYKLKDMGKKMVKVDKYFASSQICSSCGYRNTSLKDFTIREWSCPCCGSHHDRDVNAAINIRNEGMRVLLT